MLHKKISVLAQSYFLEIILTISFILFSFSLMFTTFSYNNGSFFIATKAWSDFASHIPLIRSFSLGNNFPIQYPLFPGEPIHYHFLFYALAGMLEKIGMRIDYAFNIPSALSFALLLVMIYSFAVLLFKSKTVGILSVLFFLFNGSLSFLAFFSVHPLSFHTPQDILTKTSFPSFGPYDGKIVSAFWNLNIYTNQRHLALTFAIILFVLHLLHTPWQKGENKMRAFFIGILTGSLLLINEAGFAIAGIWIFCFICLNRSKIFPLFLSIFGLLPWIIFFMITIHPTNNIHFKLGYLLNEPITLFSFLHYWIFNLGLSFFSIPLGLFLAPKGKKSFFLPLLILFLLPNIFQFSPDIINNHKFFNFFLLVGSLFSAYSIVYLWKQKKLLLLNKLFCIIIVFFFTLSGVIDTSAVFNDAAIAVSDIPRNKDAVFFLQHTKQKDIILNSTFFYHPASLAGRFIFYGYSYFAWSYGYNTNQREVIYKHIYEALHKEDACSLLYANNISYVELNEHATESFIHPDFDMWKNNFFLVYKNPESGITVYDVAKSCLAHRS